MMYRKMINFREVTETLFIQYMAGSQQSPVIDVFFPVTAQPELFNT